MSLRRVLLSADHDRRNLLVSEPLQEEERHLFLCWRQRPSLELPVERRPQAGEEIPRFPAPARCLGLGGFEPLGEGGGFVTGGALGRSRPHGVGRAHAADSGRARVRLVA